MADNTAYLSVYLSQGGSSFAVIMSRDQADKLYKAIYEDGSVVAVWMAGKAQSTGIVVNPAHGGVVLNIGQARKVPVDKNGNPINLQLIVERKVAEADVTWLDAKDQPHGEVLFPPWGDREERGPAWVRTLTGKFEEMLEIAAAEAGVDVAELRERIGLDDEETGNNGGGASVVKPPGPLTDDDAPVVAPPGPTAAKDAKKTKETKDATVKGSGNNKKKEEQPAAK